MAMLRISSFPLSGRAPVTPPSSQVVLCVHSSSLVHEITVLKHPLLPLTALHI